LHDLHTGVSQTRNEWCEFSVEHRFRQNHFFGIAASLLMAARKLKKYEEKQQKIITR
jgi:predicted nucleic acid binding AN1-type Zn finger protein